VSSEPRQLEEQTTHIDEDRGLWIPPALRSFDRQIVIRAPRATIQTFGGDDLDAYHGMIDESCFGDPEEMRDPKNPGLAPDRVVINPEGEEPVTLEVENVGE